MTESAASNSDPAGLQPRLLHLVPPGPLVSVSWEQGGLLEGRLGVVPDSAGDGRASLPPSDAQLQVALAVLPDAGGGVWARVVVSGELDIATVGPLHAALLAVAAAAAAHPHSSARVPLVLDLQRVSFLDCSALYFLQDITAAGAGNGWTLRWIPPTASGPARFLRLAADRRWVPPPLVRQMAERP